VFQVGKENNQDIFRTVFFGLVIICLAAYVYFCSLDSDDNGDVDTTLEYIDSWTVVDDAGESFTVGRSYNDDRIYSENFTIYSRIPEDIVDDSVICFLNRSDVEVYIDGVLRKDFKVARDVRIPGGTVKSYYIIIPLYRADRGKEIKMVRYRTNRHPIVAPETFISTTEGAHAYIAGKYGTSFVLSSILFVTAALVIIASAALRLWYGQRIDMMYAAFGVLIVAGWIIFVNQLYPLIFGQYYIDGVMDFLCCLMMPFAFLIYVDSIQKNRYYRIFAALHILSLANIIIWSALHFSGIMSFAVSLPYLDAVLAVVAVTVFVTVIVDMTRGYARDYRYTAIGLIGFMITCLLEIFMLVFVELKSNEIPMLAGLMFMLVFVIIQQVDDLRKVSIERQRAIDLSNAKTQFLASMSHEIRTPINSILGMNEMIIRENHDETIDGYARSVQSAGRMLLSLVNDVLDFSKIESGRIDIVSADCRLSMILREITPMLRERAYSKGLAYETVIREDVPDQIETDDVRIKQILINLINNGIKYTERGSITLEISGQYEENESYRLRFDVRDTGQGIREEDKAELFEAFSRIDIKKNRNVEGTGLGLTIVKSVVDSMNGEIKVESEYGKGTVFTVCIPVKVLDKTAVSQDFESEDRSSLTGGDTKCDYTAPEARILAVDDNTTNLSIVRLFLKRTGIVPDICVSGMDALKKCRKTKYDLILLDHMMPEPDGIETLKLIREDETSLNRDTTVIVLTANAVAGSRQMYIEAGFADYLTKPLDPVLLEQTVKRFLPEDRIIPMEENENIKCAGGAGDMSFKERMEAIEGMDYETALMNSAGEEDFLKEIIGDICDECDTRMERMRSCLADDDLKNYAVEAHALKSLMATVGMNSISEHAKKHEFEAKGGNADWVKQDSEALLKEYRDICDSFRQITDEE
jgi:signal transduction histidine kinase/CheY-like chemotaxis protein/HPt (histidine-containing phosphotransfer) domain-containing protein